MRPRENHTPFVAVAFVLTLAIIASFQIYIFREPARIAADEAHDKSQAVEEGGRLYRLYCNTCHGKLGEGVDAPPLNDKQFLTNTNDQTIFSIASSGVPGTEMPAWNQSLGGPLTDQQISQLVAFIRNWEPTAPDRQAEAQQGDPSQGLRIYNSTCIICHGENGQGTDRAVVLNDPAKLTQFDDDWYASTIAEGRPTQGMPTWGTVLSPQQIRDLVALLRAWQRGETVQPPAEHDHGADEHGAAVDEPSGTVDEHDGATDEHNGAVDEHDGATDEHDGATDEHDAPVEEHDHAGD